MEDSFKLLEERIHKAAQRLKELPAEAQALRAELGQAKARAEKAEKALAEAASSRGAGTPGRREKAEAVARELTTLKRERDGDPRPDREARRDPREPIIRAMAEKPSLVHVEIFGQTYAVRAGTDPGYVEKLAAFVDEQMKDVEPLERGGGQPPGGGADRPQPRRRVLPPAAGGGGGGQDVAHGGLGRARAGRSGSRRCWGRRSGSSAAARGCPRGRRRLSCVRGSLPCP